MMRNARAALRPIWILAMIWLLNGCASKNAKSLANGLSVANRNVEGRSPTMADSPELSRMVLKAAAKPLAPVEGGGWQSLFDGQTLAGWQVTDFREHGAVRCESGLIVVGQGASLTGINWTNNIPKVDYEIVLDAMRLQGTDFFCGLTLPVGETHCTLILGGWGGRIVGISSINGDDASDNQTSQNFEFESERWYHVRVRVTGAKIQAWLDQQEIVNLDTTGLKITMRFGDIELSKPLGVATWKTTGAIRGIKIRRLESATEMKK
ncbi:MAG: hypothetical protein JWR26_524 [Pedosphaera sp.]|nr:hypothetical protein [Pedosphaera sp.]